MLGSVCANDFVLGEKCTFLTDQHIQLTLQIQAVKMRPLARNPYAPEDQRIPFVVELVTDGPCDIRNATGELTLAPHGKPLQSVWISRVGAMGRDASLAYFQLPFN